MNSSDLNVLDTCSHIEVGVIIIISVAVTACSCFMYKLMKCC